jgi:predicted RNA-binding protein with PIN domain
MNNNMVHVIDGNNLAGKLKMLGDPNFSQRLGLIIADYCRAYRHRVILVFDGQDVMGERVQLSEWVEMRRSPSDSHYKSADDYILDLARRYSANDQVFIITDDNELKKRITDGPDPHIVFESATLWAERIKKYLAGGQADDADGSGERGLDRQTIKNINDELSTVWK